MKNYPVLKSVAVPIASCFLPNAYCRLFIARCLLPIANCFLPIAYCQLFIARCLLPIAYCLLPVVFCLLPIASCLLPTFSYAQQNTFIYGVCKGTSIVPADIGVGASDVAVHQAPSDSGYIAFQGAGYIVIVDGKQYTYNAFSASKLDKSGNLQWTRVYKDTVGNYSYTTLHDGIPVADGGFVMAGGKAVNPKNYFWEKNTHIQKIDQNGHKIWSKVYKLNSNKENWALKILQMNDGGFIVMGVTKDANYSVNGNGGSIINANYSYNTYLLRLDGNGNTMWCYYYDADKYGEEEPTSLDITADGGFIVGGTTNNDSVVDGFITEPKLSYTKAFMMKVSADGATVEWAKRYGAVFKGFPFYGDYFNAVKQTPGGGYIAVGSTRDGSDRRLGLWMVKTNALGAVEWQKTYPMMMAGSVELLSDGYMLSDGGSMTKISLAGEIEWVKSYAILSDNGIPGSNFMSDHMNATMDGGFVMSYVSSYYMSYENDSQDKIIIKTNASGELDNSCYYAVEYPDPRVDERTDTLYTLTPVSVSNASPVNSIVVEDSVTAGIAYCPVACDPKRSTTTVAPRLINGTNVCANTDASLCLIDFSAPYNAAANYHHYTIDFGDPGSGSDNYYVSTLGIIDHDCFQHNYTGPGTYTLTMVVHNSDNSESDTAFAQVYVQPIPVITLLTPEVVRVCSKDTVILSARIDNYMSAFSTWHANPPNSYYYSFLSSNNNNQPNPNSAGMFVATSTMVPDSLVAYYAIAVNVDYNPNCPVVSDTVRVTTGDNEAVITGNTTICKGGTATLNVSGGDSYVWSTGAPPTNTISVNPASNKTYWVEATTVDGCRDTAYVYVQVAQQINTEAFADRQAVCTGDQVTLYATGAANYAWSNGGNTDTIQIVAANGSNTYLVTGTSGSCTDTASVVITGDAKPTGIVSGPSSPVCQDTEYTLTASGGDSYYWTTGYDRTNPAHKIALGNASTSGGASVNIYKGGCSTTVEYNVSIFKPDNTDDASPDIGGIQADECRVCPGTEVTLRKYFYFSATGSGFPNNATSPENEGLTYQWSTGETGSATNDSIKIIVTNDTTITLITTNSGGCSISNSVRIHAKPYYYIRATADTVPTCSNSPTTLYLSGEPLDDFTWENDRKEDTLVYQPAADEWFTISATGNGCTRTDSVWVEAKPNLPEASISGDALVCKGVSSTYTASGNATVTAWLWLSDNSTGPVMTVAPTTDTTIKVQVTFTGGCKDTTEYKISVIEGPKALISGDTLLCPGGTTLLKASGGYTYLWSNKTTTNTITLTPTVNEVLSLHAFAGNCSDSSTVTIKTNKTIKATVFVDEDTTCVGTPLTLIAGGGDHYFWNTGDGEAMLGIYPANTITYTVIATTDDNCQDAANITIQVSPAPDAQISSAAVCEGDSLTLSASGGGTYSWNTGNVTASFTIKNPKADSLYRVRVSIGSCIDSTETRVSILPKPSVDAGADISINYGNSVSVFATGSVTGGGTYLWSPSAGLSCTDCASPLAEPAISTLYYVKLRDANGCKNTDSVMVYVDLPCGDVFVPKAFSPNNDGINDILFPRGRCIQSMSFKVFDRWGVMVFEAVKIGDGWDGTYKGKLMNTAIFVYYLQGILPNGEPLNQKGNVSLMK